MIRWTKHAWEESDPESGPMPGDMCEDMAIEVVGEDENGRENGTVLRIVQHDPNKVMIVSGERWGWAEYDELIKAHTMLREYHNLENALLAVTKPNGPDVDPVKYETYQGFEEKVLQESAALVANKHACSTIHRTLGSCILVWTRETGGYGSYLAVFSMHHDGRCIGFINTSEHGQFCALTIGEMIKGKPWYYGGDGPECINDAVAYCENCTESLEELYEIAGEAMEENAQKI